MAAEKAEQFVNNTSLTARMVNALTLEDHDIAADECNYMGGLKQLKDL
jgi:hypothetical protein